jgi:hypothetical protein
MMFFPEMIRNIAVVGHLHHGKTALVDMLVFETHKLDWNADTQARLPSYHIYPLRYIDATVSGLDALHGHSRTFTGKGDFYQVIPHFAHPSDNSGEISFGPFG